MAYNFLDELVKKIGFNNTPTPPQAPKQSIVEKATGINNKPDFLSTLTSKVIERPKPAEDDFISTLSKNLTNIGIPKPATITPQEHKPVMKATFGDVAQMPSYLLGKGIIEPSYNFLSSGIELATGKELPKLNIPTIGDTKFFGEDGYVDAASYQQKYIDQINAGVPEKDAYKNVLIGGIFDAVNLAFPIKGGIRSGLIKYAPERLIKTELETVSKQQLFDYFSGRKTASQLGINEEAKTIISNKMQNMTGQEKVQFLKGFDLINAKPSVVGKMFGVSEEEAKTIMNSLYGESGRESATGILPGYQVNPEAGAINPKGTPVGFEVSPKLNEVAQTKYGKPVEQLSKSEIKEVAKDAPGEPVKTTNLEGATKTFGTPAYNKNQFELKPELLFGGLKEGVFTDAFQLISNKEVATKILNDNLEKKKLADIKLATKNGMSHAEANAMVETKYRNELANENYSFPDYKQVVPKTIPEEKPQFVGAVPGKTTNGLIFKYGDNQFAAYNADYLANMKKYLPAHEIKIDPKRGMMMFINDGKIEGLLMPENPDVHLGLEQKFKDVTGVSDVNLSKYNSAQEFADNITKDLANKENGVYSQKVYKEVYDMAGIQRPEGLSKGTPEFNQWKKDLESGLKDYYNKMSGKISEISDKVDNLSKEIKPKPKIESAIKDVPATPEPKLPRELSGAKPRYNYGSKEFTLSFADDTTKALYIVAKETPSKADDQYLKFLQGIYPNKSVWEIRSMGKSVRQNIKEMAKDSDPGELKVKADNGAFEISTVNKPIEKKPLQNYKEIKPTPKVEEPPVPTPTKKVESTIAKEEPVKVPEVVTEGGDSESKIRKYITSGKASEKIAQDIKDELSGVYDTKANDTLIQKAINRVNASVQDATDFALSEVSDESIATGSVLVEYYSKLIEESTDPVFKKQVAEAAAKLFNKQATQLTDAGRTVQAASLIGKKTPEGMLRTTSKMIADYNKKRPVKNRLPEISGEDVIKILEKGKEIEKIPEGLKKEVKIKEITDYLEQLIPTPWWKKMVYVYKAGMLTGVGTHGLNIASTFFNTVFEGIKNIPATGIDIIASKFTGERTKSLVNPLEYFKGGAEGAQKGYNYLKTGVSGEAGETNLEHYKVHFNSKLGKALEKYANSVYRFLGATDSVFYYGAYKRSLVEQAKISYINNKITTDKTKYIEDFINNPTDKALELANLDAQMATFKNDTTLGQIAQYIQNRPFIGPLAQMTILPFAKTPSAVAMAMFNYTPAGAIRTFYKSFSNGNFNQKEFADGLGRIITGFGALWLGQQLFLDDKITLGYPKNEKERAKWEATGKTPYSVRLGDKWVPLVTFGPQGMVVAIGGHYANGYKETGSVAGGVLSGFTGGGSSLTEQTFLTGVKTLMDAINDPGKSGINWAGNTIASIVPSIVNNFVKGFDPMQRKSSGTILGPIKARIPGLRQTLPVKLDVWGQPLERNLSGIYTAIGPIRMSNTIEGKLNTEVERLSKLGEDVQPTKVDSTINKIKLEADEYQAYQKFNGEITQKVLETVISSNDYQKADPETQGKIFTALVSEVRNQTRDLFIGPTLQRRYGLEKTNPTVLVELVKQLENSNDNGRFKKQTLEKQGSIVRAVLKDMGM